MNIGKIKEYFDNDDNVGKIAIYIAIATIVMMGTMTVIDGELKNGSSDKDNILWYLLPLLIPTSPSSP